MPEQTYVQWPFVSDAHRELQRDIQTRALRIYEGTTEIQKIVIASQLLHD